MKTNNNKLVIALDGVSASGKGSVSKLIAKEYNLVHLETGLLYRAIGYFYLKNNLNKDSIQELTEIANNLNLDTINNLDLQNEKVAEGASIVAKIPEVRKALLLKQQDFANFVPDNKKGAILDGRDIGTIICPNANIKFFLTASLEVRAKRRFDQTNYNKKSILAIEEVTQAIKSRDISDSYLNNLAMNNKGYIVIDNSNLSLNQTFDLFVKHINELDFI